MSQALFPMALFGSIAGGFIYGIVRGNKDVDNALAEAEKKHPGFLKFYERFREAEDKADAEWRSRAFKGLLGDVLLGFVEGSIKGGGEATRRMVRDVTTPSESGAELRLRDLGEKVDRLRR